VDTVPVVVGDVLIRFLENSTEAGSTMNIDHLTVGFVGSPLNSEEVTAAVLVALGSPETGVVVTDASNSIISFKTDLASAVDSYCVGSFLKFTTGNCINQTRKISNYGGTSKLLLVTSGFTEIPTVGDRFIIINQ
jgi:hypothetical protein